MSPRALKIALAVSVALNVFAVAGGATVWVMKSHMDAAGPPPPGRDRYFHDMVASLDPTVRDRVRATLRASALAARPDFEQARKARREAIDAMRGPTPDPARVDALLQTSRAAELRGRDRLERDAVALLTTLGPADRAALSGILSRRGGAGGRGRGGGERGPRPGPPD